MKYAQFLLFAFLPIFIQTLSAQDFLLLEGRIVNAATNEALPYANVYNLSNRSGTISNTDGYFRIPVSGMNDTVKITFVGFSEQVLHPIAGKYFYLISLQESIQLLREVVITPEENNFLYELIRKCKKNKAYIETDAKVYYDLKSYRDDQQIELVEGYYTGKIGGYELNGLEMKAGRIALQPYLNNFFVSLESSQAIVSTRLFNNNLFFPANPLELPVRKLRSDFNLSLDGTYITENSDSVFVITYTPADTSGLYFSGKIWVNKSRMQFEKITLNCKHAANHPFLPLFKTDSIANVSFSITKTFTTLNGCPVFNHIDFIYDIEYNSRTETDNKSYYTIRTYAVMYAYDYGKPFFIPVFDFHDNLASDYRKINAMPYNDFFWKYNNEYRMNDSLNTNEQFFNDTLSITNFTFFKTNKYLKRGFFEHPYVQWSEKRIRLKDAMSDTLSVSEKAAIRSEQFDLVVTLYTDLNTYSDSTNVLTATIFDPYETFYHLPVDNQTLCFINLYFDLCEIKRRELDTQLSTLKGNPVLVREACKKANLCLSEEKYTFFKDVARGTNKEEMTKYNERVKETLGIDNIAIFQPFSDGENQE